MWLYIERFTCFASKNIIEQVAINLIYITFGVTREVPCYSFTSNVKIPHNMLEKITSITSKVNLCAFITVMAMNLIYILQCQQWALLFGMGRSLGTRLMLSFIMIVYAAFLLCAMIPSCWLYTNFIGNLLRFIFNSLTILREPGQSDHMSRDNINADTAVVEATEGNDKTRNGKLGNRK